jgi:hypothetical protein
VLFAIPSQDGIVTNVETTFVKLIIMNTRTATNANLAKIFVLSSEVALEYCDINSRLRVIFFQELPLF